MFISSVFEVRKKWGIIPQLSIKVNINCPRGPLIHINCKTHGNILLNRSKTLANLNNQDFYWM
ncbi:hypothetical protein ABD74_04480 [Brevibacillus laterosporus]|nr:hypothetical protein [Brevibacillus laterosporus]